jgi:nucleotide-binding universal stress UspA family protein
MGDFDNYVLALREGTPHVEVLKYARENKADLIAMAHHTKDIEPEKAMLGSTIEQVVLRSACPAAVSACPTATCAPARPTRWTRTWSAW